MTVKLHGFSAVYSNEKLAADSQAMVQLLRRLLLLKEPVISEIVLEQNKEPEMVLAKEQEMVVCDRLHAQKKYIGTTDQYDCVSLYLYSDNKSGFIHVNDPDVSIKSFLSLFKDEKNIKAMIFGGAVTEDSLNFSQNNVLLILRSMISSSLEFTITAQKILFNNQVTQNEMRRYMKENLFHQAELFYKVLTGSNLPKHHIASFHENDFETKSFDLESCSAAKITEKCSFLMRVDPLLDENDLALLDKFKKDDSFRRMVDQEMDTILKALFSKEGYALIDALGAVPEMKGFPVLRDYVVDMRTQTIHPITELTVPHHVERQLYVYAPGRNDSYFLAFSDNKYHCPDLSFDYVMNMIEVKKTIAPGVYSKQAIAAIESACNARNNFHHQQFAALVMEHPSAPPVTACPQLWYMSRMTEKPSDTGTKITQVQQFL